MDFGEDCVVKAEVRKFQIEAHFHPIRLCTASATCRYEDEVNCILGIGNLQAFGVLPFQQGILHSQAHLGGSPTNGLEEHFKA